MLFSTKNNAATVLCVGVCSIEKTAIYFFELFVTLSLKAYHHNILTLALLSPTPIIFLDKWLLALSYMHPNC